MYECYHCRTESAGWDMDIEFADYGIAGEGLVQVYHCANCGATITYMIPYFKNLEGIANALREEENK